MRISLIQKNAGRRLLAGILIFVLCTMTTVTYSFTCRASGTVSLVILSKYQQTLKIGQHFYLTGFSTSGKLVTWKSSNSRIASVNTYGEVTAKKAGTCKITGKVKGAEASCRITVSKTVITLTASSITMENGAFYRLSGRTTSGTALSWKSSRRSVAVIDENGKIEALKPGSTTITATADGTKRTCKVTVKKPKVTLSNTRATLSVGKTMRLTAKVSSHRDVVWKSRKKSVATINDHGLVTAWKKGTARITASVDGVTKECTLIVQ